MKKIEQSMIHSPVLNITTNEIINEDPEEEQPNPDNNNDNIGPVRRIPDEEDED